MLCILLIRDEGIRLSRYLEKLCVISIISLVFIVFIKEFIDVKYINTIETVLLILVIMTCIFLAKGIPFYMSSAALIIGHILIFKYKMGYAIWLDGITKNLPLAILFVVVPVLSIPLKEGGYLQAFNYYVRKYINRTCSLFFILSSSVFGLGSITNLGSIRIIHALVEEVEFPAKFLAKVYGVGFASCIAWSPYFASVNLVLYYTGVSFGNYFAFGLIYGICILLLGNFLFYRDLSCQREVKNSIQQMGELTENSKKIRDLILNLMGLFIVVVIGERVFDFSSMMLMVSFLAVLYAASWSIIIKKFTAFIRELKSYDQNILQVKNELVFFLSVGFFGVVLANTPLQNLIEKIFSGISGFSTFFVIEVIIIITVLLSSIGIHHVITVTALGLSLQPQLLGLTDLSFALTLIAAYTVSMIVSPFVPFNIIAGGLIKENSFVLGLKWNRTFGLAVVLLSGVYISVVNMVW